VWHFYDGRAGMERRIREFREDYSLPKIPTHAFEANALYLEVVRLTYNLVTAFQRGCATYKWKLSRPAFLPVVFKLAIQVAAAKSQDGVGSSNGPEHS